MLGSKPPPAKADEGATHVSILIDVDRGDEEKRGAQVGRVSNEGTKPRKPTPTPAQAAFADSGARGTKKEGDVPPAAHPAARKAPLTLNRRGRLMIDQGSIDCGPLRMGIGRPGSMNNE